MSTSFNVTNRILYLKPEHTTDQQPTTSLGAESCKFARAVVEGRYTGELTRLGIREKKLILPFDTVSK
jgi:hypothetical protein